MSSWIDIIQYYYQTLQLAVSLTNAFTKLKKVFSKEYDVREIRDGLSNNSLHSLFGKPPRLMIIAAISLVIPIFRAFNRESSWGFKLSQG